MAADTPSQTSAEIREIMRRNIEELFAEGNADLIPELYWEDVIDHNPVAGQRTGHDGLRDVLADFHRAFPDQQMELHGTLADGEFGVDFWTFRATHLGPLGDMEPTGAPVEFTGIDVARIVDGRIKEIWHVEDMATMMRQLGRS
jgi:steroid delta-isomerase-like uncharacterized protein